MADAPRPLLPLVGRDPGVPRDVRLVGRYAVGVDWQDGHGSIYPFDLLRHQCPCADCARARDDAGTAAPAAPEATWPAEIKRAGPELRIRWQDDHQTTYAGRDLRRLCRCAVCTKAH
jgi:DUF971 family protein